MNLARETAIQYAGICAVTIDMAQRKILLETITDTGKNVIDTQRIPDQVDIETETKSIYFYPNGSASSAVFTIIDRSHALPESYEITTQYATGGVVVHEKY